jgi:hypothetical protein
MNRERRSCRRYGCGKTCHRTSEEELKVHFVLFQRHQGSRRRAEYHLKVWLSSLTSCNQRLIQRLIEGPFPGLSGDDERKSGILIE